GRWMIADILSTGELARGLAGCGVTANCLHPGFVSTGLGQRNGGFFGAVVRFFFRLAGPPEPGAETIVHLASSPAVAAITGGYFVPVGQQAEPSPAASDDLSARRVWGGRDKIPGGPPFNAAARETPPAT